MSESSSDQEPEFVLDKTVESTMLSRLRDRSTELRNSPASQKGSRGHGGDRDTGSWPVSRLAILDLVRSIRTVGGGESDLAVCRVGVKLATRSWSDTWACVEARGEDEGGLGMVAGAMGTGATRPLSGSVPDSPFHRVLREVDGGHRCACEVAS